MRTPDPPYCLRNSRISPKEMSSVGNLRDPSPSSKSVSSVKDLHGRLCLSSLPWGAWEMYQKRGEIPLGNLSGDFLELATSYPCGIGLMGSELGPSEGQGLRSKIREEGSLWKEKALSTTLKADGPGKPLPSSLEPKYPRREGRGHPQIRVSCRELDPSCPGPKLQGERTEPTKSGPNPTPRIPDPLCSKDIKAELVRDTVRIKEGTFLGSNSEPLGDLVS